MHCQKETAKAIIEVNENDVAGATLRLRSCSRIIHAVNVQLPWERPEFDYFRHKNFISPGKHGNMGKRLSVPIVLAGRFIRVSVVRAHPREVQYLAFRLPDLRLRRRIP